MGNTLADNIIAFNKNLHYTGELPNGFGVLNPFKDNPETMQTMEAFYYKFYNDNNARRFIIGINPSRHGAGLTGVPFTDTKRLDTVCGIKMHSAYSHEVSSVFIYDLIAQYGGASKFYADFYINSPFPLAIIRNNGMGKWLNANYYDDKALMQCVEPFMVQSLRQHIALGLDTSEVYVLGKKNASFISRINQKEKLFDNIVVLEHPRYIEQYRSKDKEKYLCNYLLALQKAKLPDL
ncbi:SMUG2 DNA glycosylase family protein [Pedobacter sp. BS3]|uniref:SMUG2 DNA glycosylase family protein n=1 Tax=Pedobacter sp. BS3 TaxID=2567937 RepID=UPI0011EBE68D|nr:SMUG2 DNA glycosylase family protein [Pedobacter sp. BS3]TZF83584.1 SMUG2 DNA glycosylase family protein [Pedobacter sp. BS3]